MGSENNIVNVLKKQVKLGVKLHYASTKVGISVNNPRPQEHK